MHRNLAHVFVVLLFATIAAQAQVAQKLPTFPDGKWKGCHAVYSHPFFDAAIKADGVMWIQTKDATGKPVGTPFTCYQAFGVYVPEVKQEHHRIPIGFMEPAPPVLWEVSKQSADQPKTIHLRGVLQDNVSFEMLYEFKDNQIVASGGCVDPAAITYPTHLRIASRMMRTHDIKPNVEASERKQILQDCVVTTRMKVGTMMKRVAFPYADVMCFSKKGAGSGVLEFAEVKGPYGPRLIQMKAVRKDENVLGWNYPGLCPWQGFMIYVMVPAGKIDLKQKKVTMIIK